MPLKTKENLIFNDVTRNLRRNQAREIIFGNVLNVNRLRFIQIPKDARTRVNNSTYIFMSDKVVGFPVPRLMAFRRKSLEHDNCQRHHVIEKVSTKPIELEL